VATQHYAIPFWCDGRLNNGDLNVYCAKVPLKEDNVAVDEIYPIFDNFMTIQPNPIKNNLLIVSFNNNDSQKIAYSIYNIEGKQIIKGETNSSFLEIDLSKFPDGTYFIHSQKEGQYKILKFQK